MNVIKDIMIAIIDVDCTVGPQNTNGYVVTVFYLYS